MEKKTFAICCTIAFLFFLSATPRTWARDMTAAAAAANGTAKVKASGIGLEEMFVSVTATANVVIVLEAGTSFLSSAARTQNMMSASTIRFAFSNASPSYPQTLTQRIPVYCLDRFRDIPTPDSGFVVSFTAETNPIRKLVGCMEGKTGSHRAKQIAVWMVSDNLLALTPQQVAARFLDEMEKKWRANSTGPELANLYRQNVPDAPADLLESIRNLTADEIAPLLEQMRPQLRQGAKAQVEKYRVESAPLLAACGYDLSAQIFFKN